MNLNLLEKAISIAVQAHAGQTDKSGKPYILHVLRVMMKGKSEDEMIGWILHDLVEDTDWTFEQLKEEGFPQHIIAALELVTRKDREKYSDFIQRISGNPLAVAIKLNDLDDNMNVNRLNEVTVKDAERLSKYINARKYLETNGAGTKVGG
ncbi:phosphohydrolase [Chryseobacterium arthrosphaerae]|uniref:phosphohydrolase n=1 Tax=Chryseobacterium arthrosphaerae TaxID=651561 RepID=UPI0023E1631A|nr:phosphohydrolase [Chryseobacterium arthrosphaerae]WES98729.1 phosphohydrolase [Chryseobacterium arthrosphaerae]